MGGVNLASADDAIYDRNTGRLIGVDNRSHRPEKGNKSYAHHRYPRYPCRAVQREPQLHLLEKGGIVASDVEGVTLHALQNEMKNGIGRVSVVNEKEQVLYDTFAYYPSEYLPRPPPQYLNLGVKYKDIEPRNGAKPIDEVIDDLAQIFEKAGLIVVHDARAEANYFNRLPFHTYTIADTKAMYFHEESSGKLEYRAASVLGRVIQQGEHSSVDDAQATMALYKVNRERVGSRTLEMPGDWVIDECHDSGVGSAGPAAGTSPSSVSVADEVLTCALKAHRAGIPRYFASGGKVALPYIAEMAKGRRFDSQTSTYF